MEKDVAFRFIPCPLEIKERPELNVFPAMVFFSVHKQIENGKILVANAIYEPEIRSFESDSEKSTMVYFNTRNVSNNENWLVIEYDHTAKYYTGEKNVNGKFAGRAGGPNWEGFFSHFSSLGLVGDENCWFDEIE